MNVPEFAGIQQVNPARCVDWRFRRAHRLIKKGLRLTPREDDQFTLRAARYLRDLNGCTTDKQFRKLQARSPDIDAAIQLSRGNASKLEVEARLLAGETTAAIAAKCGLAETTVQAYEALFFNVADRLRARDYIRSFALGIDFNQMIIQPRFATVLKSFAYHIGPLMIDMLLDLARERQSPIESANEPDLSSREGRMREHLRLALMVAMLPGDKLGNCSILDLHRFLAEGMSKWEELQGGTFAPESARLLDEMCAEELAGDALAPSNAPDFSHASMAC